MGLTGGGVVGFFGFPPAAPPMRLLLFAFALVAAGCDSADDDPEPYAGIIEVSLASDADGRTALLLVAVDDTGCNNPLVVETTGTPTRLAVRVVGIVRPTGATCLALIPAHATVALPFEAQGDFPVEVDHAGAVDAYAYSLGFAGEALRAVRTSTTRLAGSE